MILGQGMKRSLLIICILISCLLICGCTSNDSNTLKDTLLSDKYVVVYEEYYNNSTLIGNTTYRPSDPWPVPVPLLPFDYNNSTGFLDKVGLITSGSVNNSFKILYGKMAYGESPTAYGWNGVISQGIYELPFIPENGFNIVNISRNGTVYATYGNESICLKPGDNWTSPVTTGTMIGVYHTDDIPLPSNGTVIYFPWPVSYNMSYTITNMGMYNKSLWDSSYSNK